jgi:hypothetical protein
MTKADTFMHAHKNNLVGNCKRTNKSQFLEDKKSHLIFSESQLVRLIVILHGIVNVMWESFFEDNLRKI